MLDHHQQLINKWNHTDILDGLTPEKTLSYAILFENQSKRICREIEDMHSRHLSHPQNWTQEAFNLMQQSVFPLIRRVLDNVNFEWEAMEAPSVVDVGSATQVNLRPRFSLLDYDKHMQCAEELGHNGHAVWFSLFADELIDDLNRLIATDRWHMQNSDNYCGQVKRYIYEPFLADSCTYGDMFPIEQRNKTYAMLTRGKTVKYEV
jgi:hypothetical protein